MTISTNGFMAEFLTLKAPDTVTAGEAVKLGENNTVAQCADGDCFCGVIANVRDNICALQLHGTVTVPYSGTAPTVGYAKLASNGNKGVKTSSSGKEHLVLAVDTTALTVTFIL